MHYLDANETTGKEARRQLHKNAARNIEQVLAATPNKAPTIRPPVSHHENIKVRRTRHAGHCWRSRDELISDVLLWTPTYGRAKAERPAGTYSSYVRIRDVALKTYQRRWTMGRSGERVRDIRASGATWWWWWWWWLKEIQFFSSDLSLIISASFHLQFH